MAMIPTHVAQVQAGTRRAQDEVAQCFARIENRTGEGERTFVGLSRRSAEATAAAVDTLAAASVPLPPLAGVSVSIKDLFDVAGERTRAGSITLNDAPPASHDSAAVARLRAAGAVIVGRTNMTEFAYSGVGLNPHFGTPANPYDRAVGRVPGGSSSGAAVSVADGMALAALGSDTGGSCRVPAALCGIVGYRPTPRRVPMEGIVPLSPSFDSVGAFAADVGSAARLDAVLAGETNIDLPEHPVRGLRLLVIENVMLDDLDQPTATAFERTLMLLAEAGAVLTHTQAPSLRTGGLIVAAEAYAWHAARLDEHGANYDPQVHRRVLSGAKVSAATYLDSLAARAALQRETDRDFAAYDAILAPTTPCIAPRFDEVASNLDFDRVNARLLRNTVFANMLDRPAISLPCHQPGDAPVGFMLMGHRMGDRKLFAVAEAVERVLADAQ